MGMLKLVVSVCGLIFILGPVLQWLGVCAFCGVCLFILNCSIMLNLHLLLLLLWVAVVVSGVVEGRRT